MDDFDLIDEYYNNRLSSVQKEEVLKRLQTDKEFYERYRLWIEIDDWIEEIPAFEIENALPTLTNFSNLGVLRYWGAMAASVIILAGFYWHFKQSSDILISTFDYTETNYTTGNGALEDTTSNISTYKLIIETYQQKDTTYTFQEDLDTISLSIRIPEISHELKETKFKVIKDYRFVEDTLRLYKLKIDTSSYMLERNTIWKKLKSY